MWYKKYGWPSNPFFVKPSSLLVGLENERNNLKDFATSANACLLIGPTGSGKTSLLFWLKETLKSTHAPVYINSVKTNQETELTAELKKHRRLIDKLLFRPYPKNAVLAVDEAQASPREVNEFIKVLWDEGAISSIILASPNKELSNFTDSFKDRIGERVIELTKLTKSEAIDLVKLRTGDNNPFDGEATERIVELSGYNPRKILEICERACKNYAEKGAKKINKADIDELVSQISIRPTKLVTSSEKILVAERPKLVSHEIKLVTPMTKPTKSTEKPHAPSLPTKASGFSPLQTRLIHLLENDSKTMTELSSLTGSSVGTIGKQLSILRSRNIVEIIENTRPKKYVLYGRAPSIKTKDIDLTERILEYLERADATTPAKAVPEDHLLDIIAIKKEIFVESIKSLESSGKIIITDDKKLYLVKV